MEKRGAPKGNQNAWKHGFYSKFMTETEKEGMEEAGEIDGLDHELSLLRAKLRLLLKDQPDRIDLQLKAVNMIAKLARTQHIITPADRKRYKNALSTLLKEVAIPLGLKFLPGKPDEQEKWSEDEARNDQYLESEEFETNEFTA